MNLTITIPTFAKVLINYIMASSTKSYTIRNFISKHGVVFPAFNVVYSSLIFTPNFFLASLTDKVISNKTIVSPLNIENVVSPLYSIAKILFCLFTFSNTLYRAVTFISTRPRTINSSLSFVSWRLKDFSTSQTVFKYLLGHQWYDNMGVI